MSQSSVESKSQSQIILPTNELYERRDLQPRSRSEDGSFGLAHRRRSVSASGYESTRIDPAVEAMLRDMRNDILVSNQELSEIKKSLLALSDGRSAHEHTSAVDPNQNAGGNDNQVTAPSRSSPHTSQEHLEEVHDQVPDFDEEASVMPSMARKNRRASIQEVFSKPVEWTVNRQPNIKIESKPLKIIHPFSGFRAGWDVTMGAFYFLLLWLVPLIVAFDVFQIAVVPMGIFTSAIYVCDSVVGQLTQKVVEDGENIKKPTPFSFYLGVLMDLISMVPFELLPVTNSNLLVLIHLLRARHFPKLISESQIFKQIRYELEEHFDIGELIWTLIGLTFSLLIILHWESCAVWIMGKANGYASWPAEYRDQLVNQGFGGQYVWGFYIAVSNTFPLSFSTYITSEQNVFILFVIVCAVLYAAIIGTFSSLVMGFDASGRQYKQKIDAINEYLRFKKIPDSTRAKVREFYQVKYHGKFFEEETLLKELNESMRQEIAMYNCRDLISKVSFLRRNKGDGRDELFLTKLCMALVPCYFIRNEIIFTSGQEGSDMYFIQSGDVSVIVNGMSVAELSDGCFFGEVSMITGSARTATVRANRKSVMYKLGQSGFNQILNEFPDVGQTIQAAFAARMSKVLKETIQAGLTKIPGGVSSRSNSIAFGMNPNISVNGDLLVSGNIMGDV
ncbi:uncharacterized protein BJ171DRAFT_498549 [Polychytrium aggregatum]|uniref:uncharacterized protein n=1 Tax=Polychytrium aggregatum TaxID=110093 RepID=UPI0022FE7497|nr:uncharacterized protein BJ171DRAFT_498549 [Polychytrium aggregatum]KAI9206055.1 hypothetical protein BJ171DRAFT_498549 [Polychytrium aggregatum]